MPIEIPWTYNCLFYGLYLPLSKVRILASPSVKNHQDINLTGEESLWMKPSPSNHHHHHLDIPDLTNSTTFSWFVRLSMLAYPIMEFLQLEGTSFDI